MKTILVLDIPNDIDISKMKIGGDGNIYYMRDGERASIVGNIRNIKPMPTELEWFSANGDFDEQKFVEGWNACLNEITGEKDCRDCQE